MQLLSHRNSDIARQLNLSINADKDTAIRSAVFNQVVSTKQLVTGAHQGCSHCLDTQHLLGQCHGVDS